MKNSIGIRREDLSKKGEERVALVPDLLKKVSDAGYTSFVQPAFHPKTGERKRRFEDQAYEDAGAIIQEDLHKADLIFGLKEVEIDKLMDQKLYLMFSHTHKGQIKNRKLLQALVDKKCSLIDYELITFANRQRVLTAFTYFAGYAGMADTLWALMKRTGIFPSEELKQAVEYKNLTELYESLNILASQIAKEGTDASQPPLIVTFLGNGKTSFGAQKILDILPTREINLTELEETFRNGSRNYVYKLVLDIPDMYRLKESYRHLQGKLSYQDLFNLYLQQPDHFESNLDRIFPYCTVWMNCIIWAPEFPRLISRSQAQSWYATSQTLQLIGDITCDPEGAIQFSAETWIDDPVFIYNPKNNQSTQGFEGEGIAVMAVTNLPCEFPLDASTQFSKDFESLIFPLLEGDLEADSPEAAGLPEELTRACILWKGQFTPTYSYMQEYL